MAYTFSTVFFPKTKKTNLADMTQSEPNTSHQSSPGFTIGLIFGVIVGFILAVVIYKNNKKLFANISKKLEKLIANISLPDVPASPLPARTKKPAIKKTRRPRTFTRGKK